MSAPYSPTALNIRLHHAHDLGVTQDPTIPVWGRYADNVAYLTKTVPAGIQARTTAATLLGATNMELKGEDGPPVDLRRGGNCQLGTDRLAQGGMPIVDLRQGEFDRSAPPEGPLVHCRNDGAHLLGFDLTAQPDGRGLQFSIGVDAWGELSRNLVEAHTLSDPPGMARAAVLGWVASYGPACVLTTGMVDRILLIASESGFRELMAPGDLSEMLEAAHGRWQALLRETWHRHGLPGGRESDTANAGPGVPIAPGDF